MNKTYQKGDLQIVDVSGVKPIESIVAEFGGVAEDYVVVPEPVVIPPTQEELDAKAAEVEKEALIQAKVREIAVSELKKDGVLDESGAIAVAVEPIIEEPIV